MQSRTFFDPSTPAAQRAWIEQRARDRSDEFVARHVSAAELDRRRAAATPPVALARALLATSITSSAQRVSSGQRSSADHAGLVDLVDRWLDATFGRRTRLAPDDRLGAVSLLRDLERRGGDQRALDYLRRFIPPSSADTLAVVSQLLSAAWRELKARIASGQELVTSYRPRVEVLLVLWSAARAGEVGPRW